MNKKEIITFSHINKPPEKLGEILEKFKEQYGKSLGDAEILQKIFNIKDRYAKSGCPADSEIEVKSLDHASNGSAVFFDAYISYMGLTFHYNAIGENDAAWFYYAKAQKNLGSYESWGKVLDYFTVEDDKRAKKAYAAKVKHQKNNEILIDALIEIINEPPRKAGWKSKKEMIDKALPVLEEIQIKYKVSFLLYENLESFIQRQLKNYTRTTKALIDNYDGEWEWS